MERSRRLQSITTAITRGIWNTPLCVNRISAGIMCRQQPQTAEGSLSLSRSHRDGGALMFILTLLHALQPERVFAVLDHGQHIPDGEPRHRCIVDLQEQLVLGQLAALDGHLTLLHLPKIREIAVLGAPFQVEPQLALLIPGEHRFVDFVRPVVLLLQTLWHRWQLTTCLPVCGCWMAPHPCPGVAYRESRGALRSSAAGRCS